MENFDELLLQIKIDIKNVLSEKKYEHSIRVMERAEELAKKYNVNVEKAVLIGLAHDIAKDMPREEKIKYAKVNNIPIDDFEKENIELLHAKIGADICNKKYGFTEDMQKAIKYHTTGNPKMDNLAKVLFIADKTEKGRKNLDWTEIEQIEKKGINEMVIHLIDNSIKYTIDQRKIIHPDSIYTRNAMLLEK